MKKIFALVACLSLVASLAVGGSIAYLQDQKATVNVMTLGKVEIELIEQERDANGALVDFSGPKPAYPAVGPIAWDNTLVDVNGTECKVFTPELKNVVDKIVTVKNTGKSDAFIRTIIAIEAPDYDPNDLIHINHNDIGVTMSAPVTAKIDGVEYVCFSFTYNEALAPNAVSAPSLMQLFLDSKATNEDCAKFGDTWEVLVLSQAVQAAGFDNAADALNTAFGEATAINPETNIANIADWFGSEDFTSIIPVTVKNADELAAAVAAGKTNIILADGVYDVYGCGGKTLTLSGSRKAILKLKNEGEDGCDYAFGGPEGVGNVTFKGVTIDTTENTGNYKGFAYMKGTFNDCAFVGAYSLNNANDFEFNNCEFDFKNGYFWTWGANSVTFNNCTFNGNSKAILAHGGSSTKINIKDCTFAATEKGYTGAGDNTAVVEIDPVGTNTYTITFSGSNTKTEHYSDWTRVKDGSTGHVISGLN